MVQQVSGKELDGFAKYQNDWFTMVSKGLLDPNKVVNAVQEIIIKRVETDILQAYIDDPDDALAQANMIIRASSALSSGDAEQCLNFYHAIIQGLERLDYSRAQAQEAIELFCTYR